MPLYPPPRFANIAERVQFYWSWCGFLVGFTVDDVVIAFMLGWLTIEVWR